MFVFTYDTEKKFQDCKNKHRLFLHTILRKSFKIVKTNNVCLRFDVYVKEDIEFVIEFDGILHWPNGLRFATSHFLLIMNQYYFGMVHHVTIILLSLLGNSVRPKGPTES